jgi:hypothetical protein
MWRFCFDIEVRDEDLLSCKRRFVSARYYNIQFGCLCSFKWGLLQSLSSVAYWEVLLSDSCPTGIYFDHVMDFLLTITSRQFLVYVFRTRYSCMSIVCRGLCLLVCSTFRFHEMSSSQCYVHQDIALRAMRSLRHHRRYDDLCHLMIEHFPFWRLVTQTQTFIGFYGRSKFVYLLCW